MAALRASDVDLLRRTVSVGRSLERRGTFKDTKNHSHRMVHLEAALADDIAAHMQTSGMRAQDLLWRAPEGGPLSYTNFRRRVWRPAVLASGLDPALRFPDLRHTCASWLIARGGTAKAVMAWMGHSTIKVTFDRYGHLFPHELEDLAASLSDLRRAPEGWGTNRTTGGTVIPYRQEFLTLDVEQRNMAAVSTPDTAKPLDGLRALQDRERELEVNKRALIAQARLQGRSWAEIGAALGVSKQAAWQLFNDEITLMLDRIAARAGLTEEEAMRLAVEEVAAVRGERRSRNAS